MSKITMILLLAVIFSVSNSSPGRTFVAKSAHSTPATLPPIIIPDSREQMLRRWDSTAPQRLPERRQTVAVSVLVDAHRREITQRVRSMMIRHL